MPCYKFQADLVIEKLLSPGTVLHNKDDLYFYINVFEAVRLTKLLQPVFPLQIHEKFSFEKLFSVTNSAFELCRKLEEIPITIELRQVANYRSDGLLLAYFDGNARDFFAPCPNMCCTSGYSREFLMMPTIDFPGLSPRAEFSTNTKIFQMSPLLGERKSYYSYKKASNYDRPTYSSVLKSKTKYRNSSEYPLEERNQPIKEIFGRSQQNLTPISSLENNCITRKCIFSCDLCAEGCPCSIRRSKSFTDISEGELKTAQEKSDRYWHLYRFWQRELDNIRKTRT